MAKIFSLKDTQEIFHSGIAITAGKSGIWKSESDVWVVVKVCLCAVLPP